MANFYVGLMSGTSMDGIDAALVSFGENSVELRATHSEPYSKALRNALISAAREPLSVELDLSGALDRQVGEAFLTAAMSVIKKAGVDKGDVKTIGSHGQTLRHQPNIAKPFSLQIGDADIIAAGTGIETVANFRTADIDAGGQGAPLVPPFHQWLFASDEGTRVVVNVGGIANITILPSGTADVTGFDTGPGNGLMDAWVHRHHGYSFDNNGDWACSGVVSESLLVAFLNDPYFALPPPKSTGFEYFNPEWLAKFDVNEHDTASVQATLCELSARTISDAIKTHAPDAHEVFICGGGSHNTNLMQRIASNLPQAEIASTTAVGLDPDWVEAVAFAWIGKR